MPHPVIAAMNAVTYDAVVIGNHEFNYGLATLNRAIRQADFAMLAANVYTPDGKQPFRPWAVSTRRGIKIAIVGATTPGSMLWDRDNLAGRLVIRDIVPEVRTAVRDARDAGAVVVIVVVHSGLNEPSSYDTVSTGVPSENVAARLAHEVPGIDLLVYGHSHKEMADTVIAGTLLMQPRNWASSVAIAHLGIERHNGHWRVGSKRSTVVATAHHRENPTVVAVTQEGHRATLTYATTAIGTTSVPWRADSARVAPTPLIDFILDVERRASGAQLASTAAFSLDASLPAGPITVARLSALYPYDNTLRAVRLSGAQLRAYLEQSARYFRRNADGSVDVDPSIPGFNYDIVAGVDYTIDVSRPVGERITTLAFNGRPVAPTDTFTMALNNYRQTGGGGFAMLRDAPVVYDKQLEIRQLLIDEVQRKGTLSPSDYFHPNWRIVPAAAIGGLLKSTK
jgi:2',3'-cyclic-nucleotide 2'-phosphodiesterase/3'-nucleotidase